MKTTIRLTLPVIILIFYQLSSHATVYETVKNGKWTQSATWTPSIPPMSWGSTDTIIIKHTVNMNTNVTMYGHLIINSGASLSNTNKNFKVGENSSFVNNGTLNCKYFTADWGLTDVVNSGSITVKSDMVLYEGTFENTGSISVTGNFDNSWDSEFINAVGASLSVNRNFTTRHEFDNAGALTVNRNIFNDYGYSLSNTGTIDCSGSFENQGILTSSGSLTVTKDFTNYWNSTFDNTGSCDFDAKMYNYGDVSNTSSGTMDISGNYYGEGDLVNTNDLDVGGKFESYGDVSNTISGDINVAGDFFIEGDLVNTNIIVVGDDFTCQWSSNTIQNSGTLTVVDDFTSESAITNSGNLNIGDDFVNNASISNSSTLSIGGFYESGWSCNLTNTGSVSVASYVENFGTFSNSSSGTMSVGSYFYSEGNVSNENTLDISGDLELLGGSFTNSGDLDVGDDLYSEITITNTNSLSVADDFENKWATLSNSGDLDVGGDFSNKGTLTNSGTLDAVGDFYVEGTVTNTNGISSGGTFTNRWATINNSGTLAADDMINQGTLNNYGVVQVMDDLTNNSTITNYNYILVGDDLTCNGGSTVTNNGNMSIIDDFTNHGNISNDGNIEVDGIYTGTGNVGGSGDLCNSDGITDPTGGAKAVTCNVCGDDGSGLPVELITFSAVDKDGVVQLTWTTASEVNNSHFEILRSSDGYDFEVIGQVAGHGNSNVLLSYNFQDDVQVDGIYYYRLRQVDYDGTTTRSEMVTVNIKTSLELTVFPNPANAGDEITINLAKNGAYEVILMDMHGKTIKQNMINGNQAFISSESLSPGIYLIRIKDSSGNLSVSKVLVQ